MTTYLPPDAPGDGSAQQNPSQWNAASAPPQPGQTAPYNTAPYVAPAGTQYPPTSAVPPPPQYPGYAPPAGGSGGGGSRTPLFIAIALAVVLLLCGGITVAMLLGGGGDTPVPPAPAPAPAAPAVPAAPAAPADPGAQAPAVPAAPADGLADYEVGDCVAVLNNSADNAQIQEIECGSTAALFFVGATAPDGTGCPSDSDLDYTEPGGALCMNVNWEEGSCYDVTDGLSNVTRAACTPIPGRQIEEVEFISTDVADVNAAGCTQGGFAYPEQRFVACTITLE